jgi:DNA-binding LytR/AlgR family response regulator
VLSGYITQVAFLDLQGAFKDAIFATEYLRDNSVQLIFLDIHLPRLKGMDFLKSLTHPPAVIVTTAYHQYAVEGFNLDVTDYLLKPFAFERFLKAVNKVKPPQQVVPIKPEIPAPEKDFIFVMVQKKKVKILFSEIAYIESQREYIKIVTIQKEYITKMSTHEIGSILPAHQFKRIHRSFIVAIHKIESYTSEMVEIQGVSIPIGREYRDVVEGL